MIIFTDDETPFRSEKEMFMYGTIDTVPNLPDYTYFLHTDKFTSKDVLKWAPVVRNRLVIVTRKAPKLTKEANELCVVDDKLNDKSKDDTFLLVKALVNWNDRKRVSAVFKEQPLPLLTWFLKDNVDDIKMWRRLAKTQFVLPEQYVKASLIYGITPSRKKVAWPKRKGKSKERPELFRSTDQHWEVLLENSIRVANQVRTSGDIPKGMKRRKVAEQTWV